MSITDRLTTFITDEKPSAIALVGKWGQGKTYFWHRLAAEHATSATKRTNYAYVSLFGLNSLADLRIELAQKIRPVKHMSDDTFGALLGASARTLAERAKDGAWRGKVANFGLRKAKDLAHAASGASVGIPHVGNLAPFYRGWAYSQVKDGLICLDDLERRGDGLALKDVLGLVSQLVVERRCSVAVIFNEGAFDDKDKDVWEANREKVFLGEVSYTATPELCVSYIFEPLPETGSVQAFARQAILDLSLTNVRIIERIKIACDQIAPLLDSNFLDGTRHNIARCLALYIYMVTGQGEGAPPVYEGKKSGLSRAFERMNRGAKAPPPSEQEKAWEQLLVRYNFHFHGELDEALMDAVKQGFPDADRLATAAHAYDQSARLQDMDEDFNQAWRLFHDTFEVNGDQIIARMDESFFRLVSSVSPNNADSTIRLVRALGNADLADRMIHTWVAVRATPADWKTLAKRVVETFNPIQDPAFREAIEAAHKEWAQKAQPSFEGLLDLLRQDRFLPPEDMERLAQSAAEDYITYIENHPGPDLHRTIENILNLHENAQDPNQETVRSRMREALGHLASQSSINRVRVEWKFSISPPGASPAEAKNS